MELSFETGKGTELIYAQKENPGNNRDGYTTNPPGNYFQALKGQKSVWAHPA